VNFRRNGAAAEKTLRLQYLITIRSYLVDEDKFARDIHSSGCVYLNTLAAGGEAIPLAIRVRAKFPSEKRTGPMNARGNSACHPCKGKIPFRKKNRTHECN